VFQKIELFLGRISNSLQNNIDHSPGRTKEKPLSFNGIRGSPQDKKIRLAETSRLFSSWLRHYATSQKAAGSIPVEVIGFLNLPNPSSSTMALGSTQPLTEMSTRNLPGGKGLPHNADNLTAICEPIV
jgi:hypothetical protein